MPLPSPKSGAASEIDEIEDLAVLAARSEGDQREAAFSRLYDSLYAVVVRDIRWRVSDLQTAEDLAQDVWVKVARSIASYEGRGGGFVSWLLTIARNTVIEHHRMKGRRAQETLSPDMWQLSRIPSGDVGPDEIAERQDLAERMGACIARLSPNLRDVLRLRIFDGLTSEETAKILGKKVGAVKTAQHRALSKLAAMMPQKDSGMAEYVVAGRSEVTETVLASARV